MTTKGDQYISISSRVTCARHRLQWYVRSSPTNIPSFAIYYHRMLTTSCTFRGGEAIRSSQFFLFPPAFLPPSRSPPIPWFGLTPFLLLLSLNTTTRYPKHVWSPTGGWYSRPSNWKANTAIIGATIGGIVMLVWSFSARMEQRDRFPDRDRWYPSRCGFSPIRCPFFPLQFLCLCSNLQGWGKWEEREDWKRK